VMEDQPGEGSVEQGRKYIYMSWYISWKIIRIFCCLKVNFLIPVLDFYGVIMC
jgi:hypothetical protein